MTQRGQTSHTRSGRNQENLSTLEIKTREQKDHSDRTGVVVVVVV